MMLKTMPKTIQITNINLKEISISKQNGKITIGLLYSFIDDTGNELNQKRDLIQDEELTATQKAAINNLLKVVEDKIKKREKI